MSDLKRPNSQSPPHAAGMVIVTPSDPKTVNRIEAMTVLTDSVVATATLALSAATRRATILWGDEEIDVIRQRPGTSEIPAPGTNSLPSGTYQVQHEYSMSEDGRAFDRFVTVITQDFDGSIDFASQGITITPRWEIIYYPIRIALGGKWDPWPVSEVTLHIVRIDSAGAPMTWPSWTTSNNFIIFNPHHVLEGSGAREEVVMWSPLNPVQVRAMVYSFTEKDDFSPDDHASITVRFALPSTILDGDISDVIEGKTHRDNKINYAFGREINLLRPFMPISSGVFTAP